MYAVYNHTIDQRRRKADGKAKAESAFRSATAGRKRKGVGEWRGETDHVDPPPVLERPLTTCFGDGSTHLILAEAWSAVTLEEGVDVVDWMNVRAEGDQARDGRVDISFFFEEG
jgi:hypothetical protein